MQTLTTVPNGGGEPVPEAAQSCTFTDNANESYRCTLRAGLKFADGTPVTAEDVKFSIQRVSTSTPTAGRSDSSPTSTRSRPRAVTR